jgi:hypothetical protein
MSTDPQPHVENCFRCGQPAELPVIGQGHVAGQEQEHLPLCRDCLALLLRDAWASWDGMRRLPE